MILIWERARFLASFFNLHSASSNFQIISRFTWQYWRFSVWPQTVVYHPGHNQKTELGEELLMRFFNLIYHSCEPPDWRSTRLMLGIRRKSLRCKFKKPEHTELKLSASQQKRVRKYVISQFLELTLYEQYPLTPSSTDTQHAQLYIGTFMTGSTNHKYILIKGTHFNLRIHLCAPHPCVFTCPPCVLSPELSLWGETALFFAVRGAHQGHQE